MFCQKIEVSAGLVFSADCSLGESVWWYRTHVETECTRNGVFVSSGIVASIEVQFAKRNTYGARSSNVALSWNVR